jgi:malonyl CoA-acyl carrier protein transacylase
MLVDQHCFWSEGSVSDVKGQETFQTAAELVHAYDAQSHEIVDAITAAVMGAQAGLNWLRAQPADLEEVQKSLAGIARDGKRAAEIVLRLRTLMNGWNSSSLS